MIFVGENLYRRKLHKIFRAILGKFGQKSFAPQTFACSYTYGHGRLKGGMGGFGPHLDFEIFSKKRYFFRFGVGKNKYHHF